MIFCSLATVFSVAAFVSGLPAHRRHSSRRSSGTGASSGCGLAPAWQFDDDNHVTVTMGGRSFLVHIPVAYNANTPHAVVLSFHGFKENGLKQETISGFSEKGLRLNGKVSAHRSLAELSIDRVCRASSQVRYSQVVINPLSLPNDNHSLS
jgi:poly(3-hydroxybutyrate) depolymerase